MKGVTRQTPKTQYFQYRLDRSPSADQKCTSNGSLVNRTLSRQEAEALRDVLNAALEDWQ